MDISEILVNINDEVARVEGEAKRSNNVQCEEALRTINKYLSNIEENYNFIHDIIEQEYNFFEKKNIRNGLKKTYSSLKLAKGNDINSVLKASQSLSKLYASLKEKIDKKVDEQKSRIAPAYEAAIKKRKEQGVTKSEPVTELDTAEIIAAANREAAGKEAAEQQKRIDAAFKGVEQGKYRAKQQFHAKRASDKNSREFSKDESTRLGSAMERRMKALMEDLDGEITEEMKSPASKIPALSKEKAPQKKMSFFEKIAQKFEKMRAGRNATKSASRAKNGNNRVPWYATLPLIGALIAGGTMSSTMGYENGQNGKNTMDSTGDKSYTDVVEPGTSTATTASTQARADETIKTTSSYNPEYEFTSTTETTEAYVPQDTTTPITTYTDGNREEEDETTKPIVDEQNDKVVVNIGDKITVEDGVKYTADCLGGGNSNKIGNVSWRPATDYTIDRVAFVYDGKILGLMNAGDQNIEQRLSEIAKQNGIDQNEITTSVLLSLVPGIHDTGWTPMDISKIKASVIRANPEKAADAQNKTESQQSDSYTDR